MDDTGGGLERREAATVAGDGGDRSGSANEKPHRPGRVAPRPGQLDHNPDIWLTGMKPGQEEKILGEVLAAMPDRKIRMLSSGTIITV